MKVAFVLGWLLALAAATADLASGHADTAAQCASDRRGHDLTQLNQAMRAWLEHVRADRPFIVVEQDSSRVQLLHGAAVLRCCPMVADSSFVGQQLTGRLSLNIRRYRPSTPWSQPVSGPFDWEDVLATMATPSDALFFDNGLVLYAAPHWEDLEPPAVQLHPRDLQALAGACSLGTPVVILPRHWQGRFHEP